MISNSIVSGEDIKTFFKVSELLEQLHETILVLLGKDKNRHNKVK